MIDKRIIIILLIAAAFAGVFMAKGNRQRVNTKIDLNTDAVSLDCGKRHIVGVKEQLGKRAFLVNNGFIDPSSLPCFVIIPMEKVHELEKRYGDFIHCGSPGEQAGKNSLYRICLITDNRAVKEKINRLMEKRLNSPVMEISACKLKISGNTYDGKRYVSFEKEEYFLVDDLVILQERYR